MRRARAGTIWGLITGLVAIIRPRRMDACRRHSAFAGQLVRRLYGYILQTADGLVTGQARSSAKLFVSIAGDKCRHSFNCALEGFLFESLIGRDGYIAP
jgi:hypothetical protein